MSPRIGGSPPPAVSRPTIAAPAKPAAAPPPPKSKPDSDFQTPEKKTVSLSGNRKAVARAQPKVDPELAKLVGNIRTLVQGGGVQAEKAAVSGALKRIGGPAKDSDAQLRKLGEEFKKLTPEQRQKVWAGLPAKVKEAAIKSLGAQTETSPAVAMTYAQSMSNSQLKAAAANVRSGQITNRGMQFAIGAELAGRTQWGKDNPSLVTKMRELVSSGDANYLDGRGAARTETSGAMTFDEALAKSPEALAANLAHETTHSFHASSLAGMNESVLAEETSGNLAGAKVWSEIGNPDDPNMSKDLRDGLNDYADQLKNHGGEVGVKARAASEYASEAARAYATDGTESEKAKVLDVVAQLKADPAAVGQMKVEYALDVARALAKTNPKPSDLADLGKTFKNLPAEARSALDGLIKSNSKMPDEMRKAIIDSMNAR